MYTCMTWGKIPQKILEKAQCKLSVYQGGSDAIEHMLDVTPELFVASLKEDPKLDEICELAQWLRQGRVIVYGEADAAQAKKLINSGVFAFASDENELYASILRAQADLDVYGILQRENRLLNAKTKRSNSLLREKFIQDMMFGGSLSSIDIQRQLEFFEISLENFALFAVELDPLANLGHTLTENDVNTLIFIVVDQLETLLENRDMEGIVCVRSRRIYAIIPTKKSETLTRHDMLELASNLSETMEDFGRFTVSVGISRVYTGIGQLRRAREEGDRCLAARFHLGDNCILHIDDLPPNPQDFATEINIEPFQRAISSGSNVLEEAERLTQRFASAGDPLHIKNIAVEAITAGVLAYCEAFGTMEELFSNGALPLDRVLRAATVEGVSSELLDVASRIQNAITRKLNSNAGRAIETAKAYIENHYSSELTLADVAGSVHMSQWYFSKLFRKETGTTFSDYIIDLRIRRAKELIRKEPALKNYEIAEQVGFSDSRYFGQLFKKVTGMTPGEFRRIPTDTKPKKADNSAEDEQIAALKRNKRQRKEGHNAGGKNAAKNGEAAKRSNKTRQTFELDKSDTVLEALAKVVEAGRSREAEEIASRALEKNIPPNDIIDIMIQAMDSVGEHFRTKVIFVPEMLLSARAMNVVLEILQPLLEKSERVFEGKIIIGTVAGDLHDIGKNLVATMLRGSGFDVIDLGVNVPESEFVEKIREHQPDLVGLSALLTTTKDAIGTTIKAIENAGIRDDVMVMIGGAPIIEEDVEQYGADGYSLDAAEAVELARRLMSMQRSES